MAAAFHERLDECMKACYSWKKVRRRTNDKPWISDGLRKRIKQRLAVFRGEGWSERWKKMDLSLIHI